MSSVWINSFTMDGDCYLPSDNHYRIPSDLHLRNWKRLLFSSVWPCIANWHSKYFSDDNSFLRSSLWGSCSFYVHVMKVEKLLTVAEELCMLHLLQCAFYFAHVHETWPWLFFHLLNPLKLKVVSHLVLKVNRPCLTATGSRSKKKKHTLGHTTIQLFMYVHQTTSHKKFVHASPAIILYYYWMKRFA